jgi:hypothetical protein
LLPWVAQKITPNSAFALSVSTKCFAECGIENFRFLIHFLPVFQLILKMQATYGCQWKAHDNPHTGFTWQYHQSAIQSSRAC